MTISHAKLETYDSIAELAPALRKYIIALQNASIKRHARFRVAVSGGSLPKTLSKALLASPTNENDKVDFSHWDIFFADERCVPLDHEDSNYKLVHDELLSKLDASTHGTPRTFPIDTTTLNDSVETADKYEKQLISEFANRDSVRLPTFDLLLLGCGPDGHTCSLFPGSSLLSTEPEAWVEGVDDSPKPPPKRITLSMAVVLHASNIAFVATGEGKRELLQKLFETQDGKTLPCGIVNSRAGDKVVWFTDAAASKGIKGNL